MAIITGGVISGFISFVVALASIVRKILDAIPRWLWVLILIVFGMPILTNVINQVALMTSNTYCSIDGELIAHNLNPCLGLTGNDLEDCKLKISETMISETLFFESYPTLAMYQEQKKQYLYYQDGSFDILVPYLFYNRSSECINETTHYPISYPSGCPHIELGQSGEPLIKSINTQFWNWNREDCRFYREICVQYIPVDTENCIISNFRIHDIVAQTYFGTVNCSLTRTELGEMIERYEEAYFTPVYKPISPINQVFIQKCFNNDLRPKVTLFGFPLTDNKIWLFGALLYVLAILRFKLK